MYTQLVDLYERLTGAAPTEIEPISGSGSNRKYVRMRGSVSLIGVVGTSWQENEAFIYEANFFKSRGVNVPCVLAVSKDGMAYLQEDLGDVSLYKLICKEGFTERVIGFCKEALSCLVRMQLSTENFDWKKCYPIKAIDKRSVMWDCNYFKYCFLKPYGVEFYEVALEYEFERLADKVIGMQPRGFMYRDFQSRNILIHDGRPCMIDFQGGRKGPLLYDAVSSIWQARAGFTDELKQELLDHYINKLAKYSSVNRADLNSIILFRMIQVLGAYGFRGKIERKPMFLQHIPQTVNICLKHIDTNNYPVLHQCLLSLRNTDNIFVRCDNNTLTVKVTSFSYKKGIPHDESGNGGGFVFDCRAIHNPGRYTPYKALTGDDESVMCFLEAESGIVEFLQNCYSLVDRTVEVYMRRGFTSLVVNFGCTGGQHRSVYSASHMAVHLHQKYGIHVVLEHVEQRVYKEFMPE